jgi:hypothetical protein
MSACESVPSLARLWHSRLCVPANTCQVWDLWRHSVTVGAGMGALRCAAETTVNRSRGTVRKVEQQRIIELETANGGKRSGAGAGKARATSGGQPVPGAARLPAYPQITSAFVGQRQVRLIMPTRTTWLKPSGRVARGAVVMLLEEGGRTACTGRVGHQSK